MTAQTLFRDPLPGSLEGPYISQFIWLNTPFGVEYVDRKIQTPLPGADHLTRYSDWLDTPERLRLRGLAVRTRRAGTSATAATSASGSTSTSSSRPTSTPA